MSGTDCREQARPFGYATTRPGCDERSLQASREWSQGKSCSREVYATRNVIEARFAAVARDLGVCPLVLERHTIWIQQNVDRAENGHIVHDLSRTGIGRHRGNRDAALAVLKAGHEVEEITVGTGDRQ